LPFKIVWEIQEDLGVKATEKVSNYCILGGVPYYYELLTKRRSEDAVNNLFFDVAAPLKEEGQNILRQEFGAAYKKYFSIIEAIGAGIVSGSEIANRLGVSQTTLSKYVMSLQRDFQLVERTVPLGQNPQRSKKGVYSIKDNTIAFWFHNVYGKLAPPNEEELNEFISRRFEMFCKDFLAEYLKGKGESVVRTGRWWGQTEVRPGKFEKREIDIIVETKNSSFVGECKWTNKKIRFTELEHLEESSKALKTKKPIKKVLFSKKGFEFKEASDIMLFDPERIEIEINKLP
jgi:AAA+ ATPase superfamily predicted ATPase